MFGCDPEDSDSDEGIAFVILDIIIAIFGAIIVVLI
jgi:hypothetical protein